ncbi:MAG TPA: transglutaminase-like domain-containing protein [Fimbriimonadaceae bacterium]|nr:transglutaminase-like domain-containing protein [Fimbriimonadaceae bacterium]
MKRLSALLLLVLVAGSALAQETWLGLYMMGNKIGYASFNSREENLKGQSLKRTDSRTVMSAGLLGQEMTMRIESTSWLKSDGAPVRMKFLMESGGRSQITDATFSADGKILLEIDNNGTRSQKTLTIPKDGAIIEDPLVPMLHDGLAPGSRQTFYVLDPMTASLVKNTVLLKGPAKAKVRGQEHDALLVEIQDPRANMSVFVSSKGDLIKAEGPLGIEMIPESREEALADAENRKYTPTTDLAFSTSIKTDKPIKDPAKVTLLHLRVSGRDLGALPTDEHQTVKKEGESWSVRVHPPVQNLKASTTIAAAAKAKPAFTKASHLITSASPEIKSLAKTIVGKRTNVLESAILIKKHVYGMMKPNAGIGVLRDGNEILKTREGVCRDYAILTASLMRAAGIPTRLASGLVNWDGTFFYHAWVEVWDGKRWIGLDSTSPNSQISATHVKLSHGNVEDAFTFSFLDKVKVEVLAVERK